MCIRDRLVLEDAPTKEIEEVIDFCLDVDLPVCLEAVSYTHLDVYKRQPP